MKITTPSLLALFAVASSQSLNKNAAAQINSNYRGISSSTQPEGIKLVQSNNDSGIVFDEGLKNHDSVGQEPSDLKRKGASKRAKPRVLEGDAAAPKRQRRTKRIGGKVTSGSGGNCNFDSDSDQEECDDYSVRTIVVMAISPLLIIAAVLGFCYKNELGLFDKEEDRSSDGADHSNEESQADTSLDLFTPAAASIPAPFALAPSPAFASAYAPGKNASQGYNASQGCNAAKNAQEGYTSPNDCTPPNDYTSPNDYTPPNDYTSNRRAF